MKWTLWRRFKAHTIWSQIGIVAAILGILGFPIACYSIYLVYNPPNIDVKLNDAVKRELEESGAKPNEVKQLLEDIQYERNEAINDSAQVEFIEIISNIYKTISNGSKITLNQIIFDSIKKNSYRSDIIIEQIVAGHPVKLLFRLNPYENPLSMVEVESFQYHIEKIGASKGIIITRGKFRRNAFEKANKLSIDLLTFKDNKSKNWNDDLKIPVIVNLITVLSSYHFSFTSISDGNLKYIPQLAEITFDNGRTKSYLMDLFIDKWNSKEIYAQGLKKNGVIEFTKPNMKIKLSPNSKWHICNDFKVKYKVEEILKFNYLESDRYIELKKASDNQFIYREIEIQKKVFDSIHNWQTIGKTSVHLDNVSNYLTLARFQILDRENMEIGGLKVVKTN